MINLGIIGAGVIAGTMAETCNLMTKRGNSPVKLYAIGSRTQEKADAFAKKYGVEKAYGTYEAFYQDKNVDLVYVATPHNLHYENTKACLQTGHHVLVEKAFTVNAKECEALIKLAKEKKLLLTEAIWTRYQPMRRMIDETLASGIIGTPLVLTANLSYSMAKKERLQKPELAGGALLDVGVYTLNFADMIFGAPQTCEATCLKNADGVDVSDTIALTYDGGRMATLSTSSLVVSDRFGMVHGSEGFMQVDNINNPQGFKVFDKGYKLIKEVKCPPQLTGYEYEVIESCACIEKGVLECPSMPHQDTLRIMQLMDSIRAQFNLKYPFE